MDCRYISNCARDRYWRGFLEVHFFIFFLEIMYSKDII